MGDVLSLWSVGVCSVNITNDAEILEDGAMKHQIKKKEKIRKCSDYIQKNL